MTASRLLFASVRLFASDTMDSSPKVEKEIKQKHLKKIKFKIVNQQDQNFGFLRCNLQCHQIKVSDSDASYNLI